MSVPTDRHALGVATLQSRTGGGGEAVVDGLEDIASDFADWILACADGGIMSPPWPGRSARQIVAPGALGAAAARLEMRLPVALDVGRTPRQVAEAIPQMAVHAGFAAASNGPSAAKKILRGRAVSAAELSR